MANLSNDQEKKLSNLNNSFTGRMSESFSRISKRRVEVKLKDQKVEKYQAYIESLPHFSIIGIFSTDLIKDQILIEVNPLLAYYMLDRLAGGSGEPIPLEGKKMTEIEKMIFEKFVFSLLVVPLNEVWEATIGQQLKLDLIRVESDPFLTRRMEGDFIHLTMESIFDKGKVDLNICIPYSLFEMTGSTAHTQGSASEVNE